MAQCWFAVSVTILSTFTIVGSVNVQVPGCACIMNDIPEVNGYIRAMPGAPSDTTEENYQTNYGETCAKHLEPGSSACTNLQTGEEKADSDRAAWCDSPWCYVDPCTCKQTDAGESVYFNLPLYYSYANCGGVDTWTNSPTGTSGASCPGGHFTPVSAGSCKMKMDNEATKTSCSHPFAQLGKCVSVTVDDTMVDYPANYGEGCGVHLEPAATSCSNADGSPKALANQAQWCKDPWTFVNTCSCAISDKGRSQYFYPMLIFYSYASCGSVDAWTAGNSQPASTDMSEARCPSPAPPTAWLQNPIPLPRSTPRGQSCTCQQLNTATVPQVSCSTVYAQAGVCVTATSFPGFYPVNYGEKCGVHIEPLAASCSDTSNYYPWSAPCRDGLSSGCRADWCDSPWCYVDPCACDVSDIQVSSYFGGGMYYSYQNCESTDTFSGSASSFDRCTTCGTGCDSASDAVSLKVHRSMFALAVGVSFLMNLLP